MEKGMDEQMGDQTFDLDETLEMEVSAVEIDGNGDGLGDDDGGLKAILSESQIEEISELEESGVIFDGDGKDKEEEEEEEGFESKQRILEEEEGEEEDMGDDRGNLVSFDESKMVQKIDYHIIPVAFGMLFVGFLDRINLGNVHHSLKDSLGLKEWQFSVAVAVFFVGFILMEVPSNVVLRMTTRSSKWLGSLVFFFGLISASTILVQNFGGLVIVRSLLGIAEAGLFPGLVFYLTTFWYRGNEYTTRISYVYTASAVSGAVGGFIAHGALGISSGLEGWQWLFLIEGLISMTIGVLTFFFLPDGPQQAAWLSQEERELAVSRLIPQVVQQQQQQQHQHHHHHLHHHSEQMLKGEESLQMSGASNTKDAILSVVSSKRVWSFSVIYFLTLSSSYSLRFYLPTLISHMGIEGELMANLATVPVYLVSLVAILLFAYYSDKINDPGIFTFLGTGIGAVGFFNLILLTYLDLDVGALFVVTVTNAGIQSCTPTILAWFAKDFQTKPTERAVATALLVSVGNLGGVVGPMIYGWSVEEEDDNGVVEKSFIFGHLCMAIFLSFAAVGSLLLWWVSRRRRGVVDDFKVGQQESEFQLF